MEAKAKLFGHSIHQMLIPFPLGVLGMAVVFDVIALVGRWPSLHNAAFAMIGAGVISGLLAALFGVIDFLAIPLRTRAKRIGFLHGVGNVVMLLLFAASWWFRADAPHQPGAEAIGSAAVGAGMMARTSTPAPPSAAR